MPKPSRHRLQWNPDAVSKLMRKNKIRNRNELAARLPVGRSTVYEAFDTDWSGHATDRMLALLEAYLGANLGTLLAARRIDRKSGPSGSEP